MLLHLPKLQTRHTWPEDYEERPTVLPEFGSLTLRFGYDLSLFVNFGFGDEGMDIVTETVAWDDHHGRCRKILKSISAGIRPR